MGVRPLNATGTKFFRLVYTDRPEAGSCVPQLESPTLIA